MYTNEKFCAENTYKLVEYYLHRLTVYIQSEPLKCGHPPLFRKADTWLGPNSITAQTNSPYSGHFGNKFVDSLAKQTKRRTRG